MEQKSIYEYEVAFTATGDTPEELVKSFKRATLELLDYLESEMKKTTFRINS